MNQLKLSKHTTSLRAKRGNLNKSVINYEIAAVILFLRKDMTFCTNLKNIMTLKKPEMILIDVDGTLVDSVPDLAYCVEIGRAHV